MAKSWRARERRGVYITVGVNAAVWLIPLGLTYFRAPLVERVEGWVIAGGLTGAAIWGEAQYLRSVREMKRRGVGRRDSV